MEKNVYMAPEAEVVVLNKEDVVLISVDETSTYDIDSEGSISW